MCDIIIATSTISIISSTAKKKRRRIIKSPSWVKDSVIERIDYDVFPTLFGKLKQTDLSSFRNFLRMDSISFEELLIKVAPPITRKDAS